MAWDIAYILGSLGAVGGIFKSLSSTIQEGELGCKTTFGKASRHKKGPLKGKIKVMSPTKMPFVIPFAQKLNRIHIEDNTTHLPNMRITLKNSLSYTFDASVSFDVLTEPEQIESILFKIEDWDEFLVLRFKEAIQNVLYGYDETPDAMREVGKDIKKELTKLIKEHCDTNKRPNPFKITNCGILNLSETATSQASRSVDYRIAAAMAHLGVDKLPDCVLAAALGATPVVSPSDCALEELPPEIETGE